MNPYDRRMLVREKIIVGAVAATMFVLLIVLFNLQLPGY